MGELKAPVLMQEMRLRVRSRRALDAILRKQDDSESNEETLLGF